MIQLSDEKSGLREFGSIVVFTMALKLTDTLPTYLIIAGDNAGWFIPLFSLLLFLVPFLLLLSVLQKHPDQGLLDLIFSLTGRWGGLLISLGLFAVLMQETVTNSRIYTDILNVMVYQRTPIPVLYLFLMAASCFVACYGLETIGRVAWLVIPYVYAIFILLFIFVWQFNDWLHLFPIAGPGLGTLMKEGVYHTSIYGEMFFLTALFPMIRSPKAFRSASLVGLILSMVNIVATQVIYIAVFDFPTITEMAYPFQQLTKTAQIGQVITHTESIFLFFWLVSSVVHFAVYLYLLAYFFARTLRIRDIKGLTAPLTGVVVFLGLLPDNTIDVNQYRRMVTPWISAMVLLLPVLIWGLERWKRRGSP